MQSDLNQWSLDSESQKDWKNSLESLVKKRSLKRKEIAEKMGFESYVKVKAEMSRFFNGNSSEVRRWLGTKTEKYGTPFALVFGLTLNELIAVFHRSQRGDAGIAPQDEWHPSFPGLTLQEMLIPPALEVFVDGGWITAGNSFDEKGDSSDKNSTKLKSVKTLFGNQGSGLDTAKGWFHSERDTNVYVEQRAYDIRQRLGEGEARLLPWGSRELKQLVGKFKEHVNLEPEKLLRLDSFVDAVANNPALLGPTKQPREIIDLLAVVMSEGVPKNIREMRISYLDNHWKSLLEGPEGRSLEFLGEGKIAEILAEGLLHKAQTRSEWEEAARKSLTDSKQLESSEVKKAFRRARLPKQANRNAALKDLENYLGMRKPDKIIQILEISGFLQADEKDHLHPKNLIRMRLRVANHLVKAAGKIKNADWWAEAIDRDAALELVRDVAMLGLPWRVLKKTLQGADPSYEVDACRAAVAFWAYMPKSGIPRKLRKIEQSWWAGAVWSLLHGVYDPYSREFWMRLQRSRFDDSELWVGGAIDLANDLKIASRRLGAALPLLMGPDFLEALSKHASVHVKKIAKIWRNLSESEDEYSKINDKEFLINSTIIKLTPSCCMQLENSKNLMAFWSLFDWSLLEQRAEIGDQLLQRFFEFHSGDLFKYSMISKEFLLRWLGRGEVTDTITLYHFRGLNISVKNLSIEDILLVLNRLDRNTVLNNCLEALNDKGYFGGLIELDRLLEVAQSFRFIKFFDEIVYYPSNRINKFLPDLADCINRDEPWESLSEALQYSLSAAKKLHNLGFPQELKNLAENGPSLTLPPYLRDIFSYAVGIRALDRWIKPSSDHRSNKYLYDSYMEPPSEEISAEQLDFWRKNISQIYIDNSLKTLVISMIESGSPKGIREFIEVGDRVFVLNNDRSGSLRRAKKPKSPFETLSSIIRSVSGVGDVQAVVMIVLKILKEEVELSPQMETWLMSKTSGRTHTEWEFKDIQEKIRIQAIDALLDLGDAPLFARIFECLEKEKLWYWRNPPALSDPILQHVRERLEGSLELQTEAMLHHPLPHTCKHLIKWAEECVRNSPKDSPRSLPLWVFEAVAGFDHDFRFEFCKKHINNIHVRPLAQRLSEEASRRGNLQGAVYWTLVANNDPSQYFREWLKEESILLQSHKFMLDHQDNEKKVKDGLGFLLDWLMSNGDAEIVRSLLKLHTKLGPQFEAKEKTRKEICEKRSEEMKRGLYSSDNNPPIEFPIPDQFPKYEDYELESKLLNLAQKYLQEREVEQVRVDFSREYFCPDDVEERLSKFKSESKKPLPEVYSREENWLIEVASILTDDGEMAGVEWAEGMILEFKGGANISFRALNVLSLHGDSEKLLRACDAMYENFPEERKVLFDWVAVEALYIKGCSGWLRKFSAGE